MARPRQRGRQPRTRPERRRPRCPSRAVRSSPRRRPARIRATGRTAPTSSQRPAIVRSDIRSSFGSSSGVADGVPLTVNAAGPGRRERLRPRRGRGRLPVALRPRGALLAVLRRSDRPELPARRAGDRRGRRGQLHQHLPRLLLGPLAAPPLRGLLEPSTARRAATRSRSRSSRSRPTSARPCTRPTATRQSVTNLAQVSLESDNVFADGYELELATMSGSAADGFVAELTVVV